MLGLIAKLTVKEGKMEEAIELTRPTKKGPWLTP